MVDRQKHRDEFRLRVLMTNKCDKACHNCLNDFQTKGEKFIDPRFAENHIYAYVRFCAAKGIVPRISLSGGEPGLHPQFRFIVNTAVKQGALVQVNTNGLVDEQGPWRMKDVDIRYHIGPGLRNNIVPGQTAVFILKEGDTVDHMLHGMLPYYIAGMKIKTFAEYHSPDHFRAVLYPKLLNGLREHFPVSGRHTGVQEDRGCGCDGCGKTCVTLKALWLLPDKPSSFCPQRLGVSDHPSVAVERAFNSHNIKEED